MGPERGWKKEKEGWKWHNPILTKTHGQTKKTTKCRAEGKLWPQSHGAARGCYQIWSDCGLLRTDNMSLFSSFHRYDSVWRSPDMAVSQRSLRTFERWDYNLREDFTAPSSPEWRWTTHIQTPERRRYCLCACLHLWPWKNRCEGPRMEILLRSHENITPAKLSQSSIVYMEGWE